MDRTLTNEVAPLVGSSVRVEGWLHKKRLLGGLNFLTIRDRRGIVQVLIESRDEMEKLRGLQIGTVLAITGKVVADSRAPGGAEIHEAEVEVIMPVVDEPPIEIDKPIDHKSENLDTLFEHRVVNIRNLNEQKIFKLRALATQKLREFLVSREFVEVDTPKLLAGATEGGAEVFKVDYFGREAVLAQSPQFYKQIMVGAYERIFEINHSYRAEPSATSRHLSELTMLDLEIGFVRSHDEVLDVVAEMTSFALREVYSAMGEELRSLGAPELKLADKVPRFSVAEIHEMYFKATGTDTRSDKDLTPDEERFISEHVRKESGSDLVFATDFPREAAKFYHKIDEERGVTLWADLIFRGVEIATCPLRENNYEKMLSQMRAAGIDAEDEGYKYYLQAFRYGLPTHGGAGFGVDRFVQKIIGLNNVKEATLFPRDIGRLAP